MKPWVKTLCSVLLVSCFGFAGSHAGWIENGVPITRQMGSATDFGTVSDGYSGSIIVYQVCHQGISRIIAQRVNSSGVVQWGADGVVICSSGGRQEFPQIVSDETGGAIIVWCDYRDEHSDIYAQRVNALGANQWTMEGVALCTATGDQTYPKISSDGAGGAIVTWQDNRAGSNSDIYSRRVNASGSAQWTTDGVALCIAIGDQIYPQITSDDAGGAIVTWADSRAGGDSDIYAQRVNASGAVQWAMDGNSLCMEVGGQKYPQIASDGADGAIVAWCDERPESHPDSITAIYPGIYAQRVNASGTVQWTENGVLVHAITIGHDCPSIISDDAGGAIITWCEYTDIGDIYAQRVNALGVIQWTEEGVPICTAPDQQAAPSIIPDDAGGAIVTWADYRTGNNSDYDVYAQRVSASGNVQWEADGIPICTARDHQFATISTDGIGGAIITWHDWRNGRGDIYAQRVTASGVAEWMPNGVAIYNATGDQRSSQIISDGAGGAIVVWQDGFLSGGGYNNISAQRVNASGAAQWTVSGVALCAANDDQQSPRVTSDGAGGAFVTWQDYRSGTDYDIYVQRVEDSGTVQWTVDGKVICWAAGAQMYPTIVSDNAGGAIVTWNDYRSASNFDLYAQRVDASGAIQWMIDGVPLCSASGDQFSSGITPDAAGGAIVVWMDYRSGNWDLYAQHVDASGTVQWTIDGVPLCTATGDQIYPQSTSDGTGGAIVTWQDHRGADYDIYAARVGTTSWAVSLCKATGDQIFPQITSDGAGGAIIAWHDGRSGGSSIYAQKVNASGVPQWTENGKALCAANTESLQIISDDAGGAIVTWYDSRGGDNDIYAQRVNAMGVIPDSLWQPDGVPLCTATEDQTYPQIASDGAGGAIVAWEDRRCGPWSSSIYAQRIRSSGEIVPTLLQQYSAAVEGACIRIRWSLSEADGARFFIFRASASDWKYIELKDATVVNDRFSFAFFDEMCLPGSTYGYRVEREVKGVGRRILFETDAITMPALPVTLYQNHPNPFNPQTVIRFYLPETHEISLDVYDVAGARVARLAEGKREKGYHEVRWDGRNISGAVCSSGVYFSRLKAGKSTISRKMVIMR